MLNSQKSSPHQWWEHVFCVSSCERNSQPSLAECWKTCSHQWLGRDFAIFENNHASMMRNIDLTKYDSQHGESMVADTQRLASKLLAAPQSFPKPFPEGHPERSGGLSQRLPEPWKAIECLQLHSKTVLNIPEASKAAQRNLEPSGIVQERPKLSRTFENIRETLRALQNSDWVWIRPE